MEKHTREGFEQELEQKKQEMINQAHDEALEDNVRIDSLKEQLEELTGKAHTAEDDSAFPKTRFEEWLVSRNTEAEQVPIIINPKEQNFATLKDLDPIKFGEYTINPDMQEVDWEALPQEKIKILSLEEFKGKPLYEVAQHVVDTYSDTHHIPGIEFWQWAIDEYDNAPDDVREKYKELRDGKFHFCFGSLLCLQGGYWSVPFVLRGGVAWNANALDSSWNHNCRVVLLEK